MEISTSIWFALLADTFSLKKTFDHYVNSLRLLKSRKHREKQRAQNPCLVILCYLYMYLASLRDETVQYHEASLWRDFSRDLLNGTYVLKFMNQVEVTFTRMHLCWKEETFSKSDQWVTAELPNVSCVWLVQNF